MKVSTGIIAAWFVFALMGGWSTYIYKNNDYMTYQDVPVEYVKRYITQSCHKSQCTDRYEGLFKRLSDGYIFDRSITPSMYHTYPAGSRYDMRIRPIDIKQTGRDNILRFFGSLIVYIVTFMTGVVAVLTSIPKKRK